MEFQKEWYGISEIIKSKIASYHLWVGQNSLRPLSHDLSGMLYEKSAIFKVEFLWIYIDYDM